MLCGNPEMLKDAPPRSPSAACASTGGARRATSRWRASGSEAESRCSSWRRALLSSGCSTVRFAYENADTYLRWQAGTYLDLQGEQADELDERIDEFHAWHRKNALPKYVTARAGGGAALRRRAVARGPRLGLRFREGAGARSLRKAAELVAPLLDRLTPAADRADRAAPRRREPQVPPRLPARQRARPARARARSVDQPAGGLGGELSQAQSPAGPRVRRAHAADRRAARPRPQAPAGRSARHRPRARRSAGCPS